jgi:hypothetical protein
LLQLWDKPRSPQAERDFSYIWSNGKPGAPQQLQRDVSVRFPRGVVPEIPAVVGASCAD